MGDRKRSWNNWNNNVKQKSVEGGLKGLFLTCDGYEKQSVNEAYNLIDKLLEEKVPETSSEAPKEESDDEDVLDTIKRECSESKDNKKKVRRCKQRPTGVKNCIFVTVEGVEDFPDLAEKLVLMAQANPCCRHLQRVIPVEETSSIDLKKLADMINACVARHLQPTDGVLPTYALEFKARNNDFVKKNEVLEMLNDAVLAIAPAAKVNLSNADVLFYVQVVRKTLMVSGIRNFFNLRKYSMQPKEDVEPKETTAVEAAE